jgi:hypothetical protein
MSYPPAPGTTGSGSSLPPKPPTPSVSANSNGNSPASGGGSGLGAGFTKKSSFKPAGTTSAGLYPQQSASQSYPGTAPGGSYRSTPPTTFGPTAPPPPTTQQYGPSYNTAYSTAPGTSAVSAPSYQYPQQQSSHQSSNWNAKPNNWQSHSRPQQSSNANYSQQPTRYNQPQQSYGPQSSGTQGYGAQSYGQAPHIQNPFNKHSGAPAGGQGEYNAGGDDMAAQIAQWQSAYVSRDAAALDKDGKPVDQSKSANQPYGAASVGPGNYNAYNEAANNNVPDANPDKKKTVIRQGGGKKWEDETLLEWNPDHPRLFVGNLAGETTDESLLKAFSRWPSVVKTRVIRDKRTSKSKGYGFVSFSNVDEFFSAAKEMNGKYIQSHPVIVKKATADVKTATVKDKNQRYHKGNNRHNNGDKKKENGAPGEYSPNLGPKPGGGVGKPGKKTKNGLRLLG